jgi:hypothetical protein
VSADADTLLRRHLPQLKYDSHEVYFADSAAEWTDYTANRLMRGDTEIAAATPAEGVPKLSLDFLGPTYPGDVKAEEGDVIGDAERDYAKAARLLHQQKEYRNRIYGRLVINGDERWLQYWFFYFYNDFNLAGKFIGAGRHEGDWEMIQLRLGPDDVPDYAVYAQHKHAGVRSWNQVDRVPGSERPVVYVARGSHASYFEPGVHGTGAWVDLADGRRRASDDEPELRIVEDGEDDWKWLEWPGHWGDTKPKPIELPFIDRLVKIPFDSDSPVGPGMHRQWKEPRVLAPRLVSGASTAEVAEPVARPTLTKAVATRTEDGLSIDYEVHAPAGAALRGLVVTVNSPDDPGPPQAHTIEVEAPSGAASLSLPLDPSKGYDAYVSAAFADRSPTASLRSDLAAFA